MVCVPCFIVPVLLIIWKKFLEPYVWPHVYKYWYGVEYVKDDKKDGPFNCDGGKCIFSGKKKTENGEAVTNPHQEQQQATTSTDITSDTKKDL